VDLVPEHRAGDATAWVAGGAPVARPGFATLAAIGSAAAVAFVVTVPVAVRPASSAFPLPAAFDVPGAALRCCGTLAAGAAAASSATRLETVDCPAVGIIEASRNVS
jgi:hypothetical protein